MWRWTLKNGTKAFLMLLIAVCLAAGGFLAGKAVGRDQASKENEALYAANRSSVENMIVEDGPVYVIGHKNPDSDTVCSAIAYARLLDLLGIKAEARITENVNNETAFILSEAGVEQPSVLEDASGEDIFLVDHSEYAQSAEGMRDAHIVGILDHHGVGSVITGHQLVYEARPIGATATIVWLDYQNYGLEIDKSTAHILLGAILSDTNGLTGSTTTDADKQAVTDLAEIAGVADTNEFAKNIHLEALSYDEMSDEEILFSDYKEYEASGVTFGIGLVNAFDEEIAADLAERMKAAMKDGAEKVDVDLLYASVGIREGDVKIDYIVPLSGQSEETLKAAFPDYDEYNGTAYIFRSGLGRKTKFVPGMTDFLGAHPHE